MFRFLRRVAARINRHAGLSVQRTYLYRISKPEGWSAITANDKSPRWELLSPERVGQLPDIGPFDVNDGLQRLYRGERCYTVCVDGRLAHYSWVQQSGSHRITKAGVSVSVESGEFWIYNCRTVEWARGRGIYPAILKRIVNEHFEAGYCTAWIYTTRENIACIEADALAYPVGGKSSFSDQTRQLAREAGYRAAFSFYGGTNLPGMTRPYDVKRVGVDDQSWPRFQVQAAICRFTGSYWP